MSVVRFSYAMWMPVHLQLVHSRLTFYINCIWCCALHVTCKRQTIILWCPLIWKCLCINGQLIEMKWMKEFRKQFLNEKFEMRYRKGEKSKKISSLLTLVGATASNSHSFLCYYPKVELPFTLIKFKWNRWNHATINGASLNIPNETPFYYHIFLLWGSSRAYLLFTQFIWW